MRKLKKATNLLILVGALLTALSGVVNTTMGIVENFTKEEEKKEVVAPAPVFEQRVAHGARGGRISKSVDITVNDEPVAEAPMEPITTMSVAPAKSKNTLAWVIVMISGLAVSAVCWIIHRRMHASTEARKK